MTEASSDFRRRKWTLAIRILGAGMILAWLWALRGQFILHQDYPFNTILGNPTGRYADFTDEALVCTLPNPYVDPTVPYPPPAMLMYRALSFSDNVGLILIFFLGITALALLLVRLLEPIVPQAWPRVALAYLFLALSYPLLFCFDRGNIEIVLAPLIAWPLYFYSRQRDLAGTACLFPAICMKFYPAILLVLLLRKGKIGLAIATALGAAVVIPLSGAFFGAPYAEIWTAYHQSLVFVRDTYILGNSTLAGSASLWNFYKITLLTLEHEGLISHVVYGFDGEFIRTSYRVYSALFGLFTLMVVGYAALAERHLPRAILLLLLYLSIAVPGGSDYRLLYASMALAILILLRQPRRGDWLALVLLAVALIPKKEIILTFLGKTASQHADVSIQSVLNPVFILAVIVILLSQCGPYDLRRKASRFLRRLFPSLRSDSF